MKKIFFLFLTISSFSLVLSMEEKKWIFLRTIDLPDKEVAEWRIKDKHLELNIDAKDIVTQEVFMKLLQEAQINNNPIPYILIGLRDDKDFYYFFDSSFLVELYNTRKNLITKNPPKTIEIFVAGNDKKLTFLFEIDRDSIKNNFLTGTTALKINENLRKPGYGQFFIAQLFKQDPQIEISKLQDEIIDLTAREKEASTRSAAFPIYIEIETLRNRIKNLQQIKKNPESIILARQWYEWALQDLPKSSIEYVLAEKALKDINVLLAEKVIPQEPEAPKKPQITQETLMQSLQNLTRSFLQLSAKLAKLV